MKPFNIALIITLMAVSFVACGPTVKTAASWVNKDKPHPPYKTIFITVLSENLAAKTVLENDLANAAAARGLKAYRSLEAFGPVSTLESIPVKESFLKKVKELGCDAIFTVALVNQKSETRYIQGSPTLYVPYTNFGYYGNFSGYYDYGYGFYKPGYYETNNTYFIESNLYDADTQQLMLSIQSKAANPKTLEKGSALYTASLIKEIQSLKKQQ